ncbi:hypothetical protein C0995_005334 [Termitomyces sp. Mi166|nr:hypothetical protein C0995_005334 [Termitomyces sp. Mi166\
MSFTETQESKDASGTKKNVEKVQVNALPSQEVEFPEGGWRAWSVVFGVYHLMVGGSVLFSICLFMLSLTHPQQYYQVFLAHGLGLGIASGMTYVPGVRASAGLNTGLLVVALLLMRTRLLPSPRKEGSTLQSLKIFLQEPATSFILAGLYIPVYFIQLKAIMDGLTPNFAFYTLAFLVYGRYLQLVILNGVNTIGRVIPNFLVPTLGAYNIMLFCMISAGILIFCMPIVQDIPGTVVFAILYGFFSGGWAGLLLPLIASLAQNDAEIGARIGICFAFTGIGGLVGAYQSSIFLER